MENQIKPKKYGKIALIIFGVGFILTLLISGLATIPAVIASGIYAIMGLRKDEKKTMSIVAVVLNAMMMFILMLLIVFIGLFSGIT